uniref:Uncharacterized protein n=1 Tax=Setaria viridis TaxID=4556 RepID=A0A4U6T3N4_SETVI|nr:hypothetical protein SEVIR_9G418150v2 [Setaria viridis]
MTRADRTPGPARRYGGNRAPRVHYSTISSSLSAGMRWRPGGLSASLQSPTMTGAPLPRRATRLGLARPPTPTRSSSTKPRRASGRQVNTSPGQPTSQLSTRARFLLLFILPRTRLTTDRGVSLSLVPLGLRLLPPLPPNHPHSVAPFTPVMGR